ncbi:MAG: 50S ribosome-binding GTPase [Ignavibacteriales bacterium]|nr:50S ribosome-binding GTPase [Ignavibacteriales bacterium]
MKQVLRIAITGNVDDGKSTLIGRLLYETKSLPADKVEDLIRVSKRRGFDSPDFSLLTDGLLAEREQGITIDVAHVYFQTPQRKFIVADTPGHEQYTRNMVTGASTSNVALILIDARNGSLLQTYRHFFISHILRLSTVFVCVNKMDLVDYSETRFGEIVDSLFSFAQRLGFPSEKLIFVPLSASLGDNITTISQNMSWYKGKPILELLETLDIESSRNAQLFRFQVQHVLRSKLPEYHDYRGYAGKIASGKISVGDAVTILPSQFTTNISGIDFAGTEVQSAQAGESVSIRLEKDLDLSRGDMIVKENDLPTISRTVEARVCWLNERPAKLRSRYLLQHGVRRILAKIDQVKSVIHPELLEEKQDSESLSLNDIGDTIITTATELFYDPYEKNKSTGAFILIDESTNDTVAVGVII